jgi:hypothetical protein
MQNKKVITTTRSEFAEKFLYLNGMPFSLTDYPHMYDVYNSTAKEVVMKTSRQVAKSTTMANIMITDCATNPYFKTMYVSPTVKQTKIFSNDRVGPVIESSPLIKDFYVNSSVVQNVFTKAFLNGSRLYLQYALLNADKLRGISTDKIFFDEMQDLKEDTIPIIQESTTRSLVKNYMYAGTPKRSKGTLARYWFRSTQNEYMVKCNHCRKWNILGEDNIGNYGVICAKCGKPMPLKGDDLVAEWISTYTDEKEPKMEGYRVCALHFAEAPWVDWELDILGKRERYSTGAFFNEVLGLEYDDGVSPITEMELQACCNNDLALKTEPDDLDKSYQSVLGIDYGPVNSDSSHTTVSIIQKRLNKYYIVYMKKFMGKEADYAFIHREIPRLMREWNCTHIAADYGMGEAPNAEIRSRVGHEKVIAFQHHHTQKEILKWNDKMQAYVINRTASMLRLFNAFKKNKIVLPKWEYTKPFAEDIMNIQAEYNEDQNSMKYTNIGPDDFFHATLYALFTLDLREGESLLDS